MKKFIKEKYADRLLQLCSHYKNTHPDSCDRLTQAVERSLGTLDKYSYYILGMGYMVETEDIPYIKQYIMCLKEKSEMFSADVLTDLYEYLSFVEREDVF